MSAKLIICAPGRPAVNGHKRHRFLWNPTHNCYVFENREYDESEFNAAAPEVFKKNADIRPYARVVQFSGGVVSVSPAGGVPAPVATLSAVREITLEDALAVVQRLAPERLRKTNYGRKPVPQMEVV